MQPLFDFPFLRFRTTGAAPETEEAPKTWDEVLWSTLAGESPFPEMVAGEKAGTNGLFRLNYFDGRLLTARAMGDEQKYWDARSRLVAQTHRGGIAWGLELKVPPMDAALGAGPGVVLERIVRNLRAGEAAHMEETGDDREARERPRVDRGGIPATETLVLRPGVAFDDVGRPIVVGKDFHFTIQDLVRAARKNPRRLVPGGTQFAPCVCLDPVPPGTLDSGASLRPGPYLLIIEPGECPEGTATVHGDACAKKNPGLCVSDGWRGSFGLSLAWLPTDPPVERIETAWALRGLLAAYYFDVFERSLITRWQPPFPGAEFCGGPGPAFRLPAAVPLAMVYIGTDGSGVFVDPWIPRRPIVETASAAWEAGVRGACTRSATLARRHQFQCQLAEGLAKWKSGQDPKVGLKRTRPDLLQLGLRHIPAWGWLPVDPPASPAQELAAMKGDKGLGVLLTESLAVRQACADARAYFRDTNVITYCTVAPLEDDVFEDMVNAAEKDPIPLRRWRPKGLDELLARDRKAGYAPWDLARTSLTVLGALLLRGGITMESLVNREISVVKLVVPMEGRRRVHPIVGRVGGGPSAALDAWASISDDGAVRKAAAGSSRLFGDFFGWDARPRSFVFYVKQRMVLLDWIYLLLDMVLDLVAIASGQLFEQQRMVAQPSSWASAAAPPPPTEEAPTPRIFMERISPLDLAVDPAGAVLRDPDAASLLLFNTVQPLHLRDPRAGTLDTAMARRIFGEGDVRLGAAVVDAMESATIRALVTETAVAVAPELAAPGYWTEYRERLAAEEAAGLERGLAPAAARAVARDTAIDAMMDIHPGTALLRSVAVFAPAAVDGLAEELEAGAARAAPRDDAGGRVLTTVAMDAFRPVEAERDFRDDRERRIFALARRALGDVAVTELVADAEGEATVEEVLSSDRIRVARLVGAGSSDAVVESVVGRGRTLRVAGAVLAADDGVGSAAFRRAYDKALAEAGGKPVAALEALATGRGAARKTAEAALKMREALPPTAFLRFWNAALQGST